jgi:ferric-dicitrate binding protein FerR (iron transport regulator)
MKKPTLAAAVLLAVACGAAEPVSRSPPPAASPGSSAVVVLLNGSAEIDNGGGRKPVAARSGAQVPQGASLLVDPGSAALVRLPDGSTVELGGPVSAATVGGTALQSSFRLVSAPVSPHARVTAAVFGRADVVDVGGSELTLYAGVATVRAPGDARFSVVAMDANHGDATVSVTKGAVIVANGDGAGQPQTVSAGQQLFLRGLRGH